MARNMYKFIKSRRHAYLTVSETKLEYILEINMANLRLQLFQQNIYLLPKFIDIGC